jgi:serine/threonine-protein kinase
MSLDGSLVLPPDVQVIPVAALSAAVRDRLGFAEFALTHPNTRGSSTLVDGPFAELLHEFRRPATVVEAVLRYSRKHALDPESVLDDAFPALRRCVHQGYLLTVESPHAAGHDYCFAVGDRVFGGVVARCLQALDDSEIYRVELDDGGSAALKVLHPQASAAAIATFEREVAILDRLGGRIAPRLLGSGIDRDCRWMAMEWCAGVPVTTAAAGIRGSAGLLLALCRRLATAYAGLHALGVLHGDVHPGNVIVAPDGTIRLVDFGLARRLDDPGDLPPRGGAPGYLAPDHAAALLANAVPGPTTPSAEVYSLGVLLYELFTGRPYLELAISDEDVLRQIVGDPMLPFARRWPDVEAALSAALVKDPRRRLGSVASLARRLDAARGPAPAAPVPVSPGEALLSRVLSLAQPDGTWFTDGIPTAPMCSIAYGSAGLAAAVHRVALLRDDAGLLALADEWAVRASDGARGPDAFRSPVLGITEELIGPVTPFHQHSGVHAVQALVGHSLGDPGSRQRALDGFVRASRRRSDSFDLALGRTGTLLACAILVEACAGDRHVDLGAVTALGDETFARLWEWLDTLPPIPEAEQLRSLGIAHGWGGLLFASLRWCRAVSVVPRFAQRLDQLASLAEPDGLGLRWPWSTAGPNAVRGWCNGSAGLVHLWTAAHTAFGDERWLRMAEGAARYASAIDGIIPQLCCGLAGEAYAQLEMYRHSGEDHWLMQARRLADAAAARLDTAAGQKCVTGSLHKGDVGIAVLAADLERPEEASMPFFGPAG